MAEGDFLALVSGLAQGVETGLERKRDRNSDEKQRQFQLKRFDAEQRRAASLDALNEEVAKSRIALQSRAVQLDEDRAQREKHNSEEIPYMSSTGEEVMVPRSMARDLTVREVLADMEKGGMFKTKFGLMAPADAARTSQMGEEATARRTEGANRAVQSVYETARQLGIPHVDALKESLSFGTTNYPNVYNADLLKAFESGEEGQEQVAEALGVGPASRATLAGFGAAGLLVDPDKDRAFGVLRSAFAKDPIERLREALYGPRGPENLQELQAARESAAAEQQSQLTRGLGPLQNPDVVRPGGVQ